MPKVFDCHVYRLQQVSVVSGRITFVENGNDVPFDVKRVFYLYDIPAGEDRGAHAHKECHQILIAVAGSFEIVVEDGRLKKTLFLNQPFTGLHIPPGIWAHQQNFSSGSICLVLASHPYNESDYIRNYEDYLKYRGIC